MEAASGILLLLGAALAMGWANSPWSASYTFLWNFPLGVTALHWSFERPLHWFVNDGGMVLFFFSVGLELRREMHAGSLSDWRRASLPAIAALGGMLVPALLYWTVAGGPVTRSGWGVPMATDIAFAIGVLTLLGKRVPNALRVLLLALAVIDDLGAILVIALFYSTSFAPSGLVVIALGLGAIVALRRLGVRRKLAYVVPGVVVWAGTYATGVHPTIAGVVLGALTPTQPMSDEERESPAESLIGALHPWVVFGILPVFALANAGVAFADAELAPPASRVALGVALGLLVGKPLGVLAACAVALRLRVATLPRELSFRHLALLGTVAGIGFTMALFVAQLAFDDQRLLAAAKLGILAASLIAGVATLLLGARLRSG